MKGDTPTLDYTVLLPWNKYHPDCKNLKLSVKYETPQGKAIQLGDEQLTPEAAPAPDAASATEPKPNGAE